MLFITNESESGLNDGDDDDEMMNWQSLTLSLQGRLKVKKSVTNHVYIVPSESFTLVVLIFGEIRLHAWSESCQSRFLLGHNQIAPPGWAVGCLEKSKNLFFNQA